MEDRNRKHRRIQKSISMQYTVVGVFPKKWDMCVIENISAGGIKFTAPSDLNLKDKTVQLQIRIPELAPRCLEIEAFVLDTKPRFNPKYSDIRAKFINLSEMNQEHLSIVEKMIDLQEMRNAKSKGK